MAGRNDFVPRRAHRRVLADLHHPIGIDDERARVGISRTEELVCPLHAFQDGGTIGDFSPMPDQILVQVTGQPLTVILAATSVARAWFQLLTCRLIKADDDITSSMNTLAQCFFSAHLHCHRAYWTSRTGGNSEVLEVRRLPTNRSIQGSGLLRIPRFLFFCTWQLPPWPDTSPHSPPIAALRSPPCARRSIRTCRTNMRRACI